MEPLAACSERPLVIDTDPPVAVLDMPPEIDTIPAFAVPELPATRSRDPEDVDGVWPVLNCTDLELLIPRPLLISRFPVVPSATADKTLTSPEVAVEDPDITVKSPPLPTAPSAPPAKK